MSTLPYVWLTCAFGHCKRGETQLVCWCAFLEAAWCPAWDPPGGGRPGACKAGRAAGPGSDRGRGAVKPGLERAHVKPGLGNGQVKSGSGTRAGQIRNGKGRHQKKKKTTRGCWFLPAAFHWGFNQGFYWAAKNLGFYLGLAASGFYLGKNLGRSPGVGKVIRASESLCRF